MISRQELERLAELRNDAGIVSAYIKINPHLMHEPQHPATELKGALKRFESRPANEPWLAALERERPRLQRFFEDWRPSGRGLAIFACEPAGIWEVHHLDVDVPNLVTVDITPHTSVLARILDECANFVVTLVQRDRGRIYISEQRNTEEVDETESDVPRRHDQGGWAQARLQRHVEFHVAQHLKHIVDELQKLYYERGFDTLVVGGPEEVASEFVKMLPSPIARCLVGTFHFDAKHEGEMEILARARDVLVQHERRSEQDLVEQIVTAAKSGGRGALGMDATLEAIVEQRVQTLALPENLSQTGSVCKQCGYFAANPFERCPACGGEAERTDVVEWAVESVLREGGHVEVVYDAALERLQSEGGIGALLRF